jgi:hypothetical protein
VVDRAAGGLRVIVAGDFDVVSSRGEVPDLVPDLAGGAEKKEARGAAFDAGIVLAL